jgi:hypothetical protein
MTKFFIIFLMLTRACFPNYAQDNKMDRVEVATLIQNLFDALHQNDSTTLRNLFTKNAIIETIVSENNITRENKEEINNFIKTVGEQRTQTWDERTGDYTLAISGDYAVAVIEYSFYLDGQIIHCGIDEFELLKTTSFWKIDKFTDTRQTTGCSDIPPNSLAEREKLKSDTLSVNTFLDNWHEAAAKADEAVYFDSMDNNGIYIGTDATECWTRKQFYDWAFNYFQCETAWDFKPTTRNVHFSKDGSTVWFNELLNTWIGACRGSGTLHLGIEGWKIDQYHLAVTIPNDKIKAVIDLIK